MQECFCLFSFLFTYIRIKVIIALNQLHTTYITKIPGNSAEARHSYIIIGVEDILYFRSATLSEHQHITCFRENV